MHVGMRVDRAGVSVAMRVNEIGPAQQLGIGEDIARPALCNQLAAI